MFLGVWWGGVITFTYLRTPMMLRHGKFTCTCAHTSCYVEDVSRHAGVGCGGVGWGNNVHVLAHSHDVTPRHDHLHVRTYVMLRHDVSRHAGVGCGGVITFTYLRTPMMLRHDTFTCTCAHTSCYVEDVSRHAGVGWGVVGWGNNVHVLAHSHDVTPRHVHLHVRTYVMLPWRCWPHLDVRSHMAVAMGGKCSWKSPLGENRCVLSEDVEITGKNGCRWGCGHADFPKGTFFALRHVNYIQ